MGTYTASVKYTWEIIDQIADELIALPEWEEGDATWDTSDKTLQNARRVVHHIADDEYVSLIMENGIQYHSASSHSWRGLVIIFSSGWDAVGHKPDGTKYYTFAGFEGAGAYVTADLATLDVDYRLFTWEEGFALVGVPLPRTDSKQSSFIAVVERNTVKLYADGFTNFYVFVDGSYFDSYFNSHTTNYKLFDVNYKWWKYSRPFTLQSQTGFESPYDAIVSKGDDKAYFTKPIMHNAADNLSPIYQGEMFMMVTNDRGLVDDDEIAEPGPSTKKYQVAIKQSPNFYSYMSYAIMKAE